MRTMTHASSFLGGWRFSFKGRVLQNKRSSCRGRKSRRLSLPYTWLPIAMQKFTDIINTRKLGSLLAISTMGGSREVWNATNENMYITNTLSIDRRLVCGNFQEKELHLSCMLYKLLKYCKMLLWSCKLLKLLLSLVSCKSLKFMNSQKEIIPHSQNAWAPINPHSTIFSPGEREKKNVYIYIFIFKAFLLRWRLTMHVLAKITSCNSVPKALAWGFITLKHQHGFSFMKSKSRMLKSFKCLLYVEN